MSESLRPHERIRKQGDFARIYKEGSRYKGKFFNLVYLANALDHSRMAAVASKRVGRAVERNKAKRWMRALFRRDKDKLSAPLDVIVIAKPGMPEASWGALRDDFKQAVHTINEKSRSG